MALPRCVVPRYATACAESLEGAMSGHQSWALLCRYRCRLLLAEIPKGVDKNSELKQRLQLRKTGQINALIGGRRSRRQTNSAGLARGSISKAMKGLDGRGCAGFSGLPQELDHSPHSMELEHWNSAWSVLRRRRAIQTDAERDEGACSWAYWRTAGTLGCHCLLHRSWPEGTLTSGARHSHEQVGDRRRSAASCSIRS